MKHLSDYMQDSQTELFKTTGAFFAFSQKQFYEKKQENVKYTPLDGGMICPEDNVDSLVKGLEDIYEKSILQDLFENGKNNIILRELENHECFHTHDIDAAVDKLKDYPITQEQILHVFNDKDRKYNKYQALSPDGFPIAMDTIYYSPQHAVNELEKWIERYSKQGYYSSNEGRIFFDDIQDSCTIQQVN